MEASRASIQSAAAQEAVRLADASDTEKAEMLMEIAMGLQQRPKTPEDLTEALMLYQQGIDLCPADQPLLQARIRARLATAQMMTPGEDTGLLDAARASLEAALEVLALQGTPAELAEAEMNYGLVLQNLAGVHKARIQDSIAAYQRALRTFQAAAYPAEFAILQNNLATAFLSIPFSDERSKMREALAVQAFEEGLKAVTLVDHPSEYAMLQNNLGNALQYTSSSHRVENGFRALEAYEEALRVRTLKDTPLEYANTLANKANCLANLPDDPGKPTAGNAQHRAEALQLYQEARGIFHEFNEKQKVAAVSEAILALQTPASTVQDSLH